MSLELQRLLATVPPEATRSSGFETLRDWRERVTSYAQQRNFDTSDHLNVSQLSRFLTHRLMLEEEVLAALLEHHSPDAIAKFTEEVCWRTYWKGWLEHRPKVWEDYRGAVDSLRASMSADLQERLARAEAGETGLECFDHWVRELLETGYLHNHARMWFASIWIFTLRLPWQLGAAFFLRHLFDGDVASNTLSWRWVAGLHTPGKHYVARAENIARFTEGRFHPVGELAENPEPLTEDATCAPIPLHRCASSLDSLYPDLSESPAGLLVTAEDLSPEQGVLSDSPFQSVA